MVTSLLEGYFKFEDVKFSIISYLTYFLVRHNFVFSFIEKDKDYEIYTYVYDFTKAEYYSCKVKNMYLDTSNNLMITTENGNRYSLMNDGNVMQMQTLYNIIKILAFVEN